jgi:hypothetical protein
VASSDENERGSDHSSRFATGRRDAMKRLLWVAPAIVATATVKARAQSQSCAPPPDGGDGPCPPDS